MLVEELCDTYRLHQGTVLEKLFKTAARDKNLDVSEVYFQPEGDVFVSYTRDYDVAVKMSAVLNTLISNDDYLTFVISQTCS